MPIERITNTQEIMKLDKLNYENLSFDLPLPFPNGLIKMGYRFVVARGTVIDSMGNRLEMVGGFEVKPNSQYTLSLPIKFKGDYICPNGKKYYGEHFCIIENSILEKETIEEQNKSEQEEEISEDDPRYIWRMPMD